jgi:hypothetical protein
MQTQRVPYTLEELIMGDEAILDQRRIHDAVTSLFHKWFAHDNEAPAGGIGRPLATWQNLQESEGAFIRRYQSSNILPHSSARFGMRYSSRSRC